MFELSLDALLLHLLEATTSSDWEGWLGAARTSFAASAAALVPLPAQTNRWAGGLTIGVSRERDEAYRKHFHSVDTWMHRMRAADAGVPATLEMLVPERELYRSEIYNDFMKPAGRRYCLGVTVDAGGSRFLLAFSRGRGERDFDGDQLKALERLSAFLGRALVAHELRYQSEANLGATHDAINQYPYGVVILDASQRVIFFNKVAGEFIAAEDFIGVRNGQILAMNTTDDRKLKEAIQATPERPRQPTVLMLSGVRTRGRVAAALSGVTRGTKNPFDPGTDKPAIMITLTRGTRPADIPAEQLEFLFGFTRQEARTASLLASGMDVNEVANLLSISRETVRYYLKSLFGKTGTHSQRAFVQFVSSSLPPRGPESTNGAGGS